MIKLIGFFVLFWSFPLFADNTFPAPFGLTWGDTEANLQKEGFTRARIDDDGMVLMTSVTAPKPWSMADTYLLVVYKDKLVKAVGMSADIDNDIYGSKGKESYNKIKSILSNKYGAPSSHQEVVGLSLYEDSDEFYQCLDYAGCGNYYAFFKISGGNVGLQLDGRRRGVGYISVAYESPGFKAMKNDIKNKNNVSDADAL